MAMAGFDSVQKCFCLFLSLRISLPIICFCKQFLCGYIMLNTAPKELEESRECLFMQSLRPPLLMLACKMIAETSEHNIYADAGLSSPIRLSSVMILKFLLSLYDCTISTTQPVHLINLNILPPSQKDGNLLTLRNYV